MNVEQRIIILEKLGNYILESGEEWTLTRERAERENNWFTADFILRSSEAIARRFLKRELLEQWTASYSLPNVQANPRNIGIVMAGNIPLVGFHDFLSVFISGHKAVIKTSSKDNVLIRHLAGKLIEWAPELKNFISFAEMLKGCDGYIATGSNNTARYFETYFGKYPSIIRKNRTSVALLDGKENEEELSSLADDVCLYFGLGCRNVTKLYVPRDYNFEPLLKAFNRYIDHADHHKYKNNYDYQLAICIINNKYYMTNGSMLLLEETQLFSPISQLNYEFYEDIALVKSSLQNNNSIQCIVGKGYTSFGKAQSPELNDYADGIDTLAFLASL